MDGFKILEGRGDVIMLAAIQAEKRARISEDDSIVQCPICGNVYSNDRNHNHADFCMKYED